MPLAYTGECSMYVTYAGTPHNRHCADGVWYYDIGQSGYGCVPFTADPEPNGWPPTAAEDWTPDTEYSGCDVSEAELSLSWD